MKRGFEGDFQGLSYPPEVSEKILRSFSLSGNSPWIENRMEVKHSLLRFVGIRVSGNENVSLRKERILERYAFTASISSTHRILTTN
jgi:hypothetical protein